MENKYIEAFENIIFQKRDNGYISDAYRNDIDVVYEALDKLEKLELLKSIIEVVPQYKYSACNVLQIKIKQDLIYNDTFALLVKSIVEDKDIKDLLKEFPMIHYNTNYGINKEENYGK